MKRHEILFKMNVLAGSLERQGKLLEGDTENGDNDITVRMVKRTMRDVKDIISRLEAFEQLL